jgi:hypothetical protein
MKKQKNKMRGILLGTVNIILLAGILFACAPLATATDAKLTGSQETPPLVTLPSLPAAYQTSFLNPLDTPRAYVQDACQYLHSKWNPRNAEPGTVVIIVMFGEIYRGSGSANGVEINDLKDMMKQLRAQGFEAINTKQFLGFMERNVKIPPRSVLLIRDGNYPLEDYDKYFSEYWEQWGWSLVNGWVSRDDMPKKLWLENAQLENSGFVDHQAQGVQPDTYFTDDSSKVIITRELGDPINLFKKFFDKSPVAFIWPNGGFGMRPIEAARLLGYQLGFTSNARGPVMYNWVPQSDQPDSERPAYIPEGLINDPLMTLPRYSPRQVIDSIDTVRLIGNEARAYAEKNKTAEFKYYKIACEPAYGQIPSP